MCCDERVVSLDFTRLLLHVARQMEILRDGTFLARRENILIFCKPGTGKSHALAMLSKQLILQGHSLRFTTCRLSAQHLLIAKRDLRLPQLIKHMSSFEVLIIDDLFEGCGDKSHRCTQLDGELAILFGHGRDCQNPVDSTKPPADLPTSLLTQV